MQSSKSYFKKLTDLYKNINELKDELYELKEKALNISSKELNFNSVQSSNNKDSTFFIDKYIDLEMGKLQKMQEEYCDMLIDARKIINQVSSQKYKTVLIKAYILNKTFVEIADEMEITINHAYKIHGGALLEVTKIINDKK